MKKLITAALLLVSACTPLRKEAIVPPITVVEPPPPVNVTVNASSYSITLPASEWRLAERVSDVTVIERTASPKAIITIKVADLPRELSATEFGEDFVKYLAQSGVDVIDAAKVTFGSRPGSAAVISEGKLLMLQIAVASSGKAHVVRCIGSENDASTVLKICQEALQQFTLK